MKIYALSLVSIATEESTKDVIDYANKLKEEGHEVFVPIRDVDQTLSLDKIVDIEVDYIKNCDEVHIFWHRESKGGHFDLGVAIALNKKIKLIKCYVPDVEGKSYEKVIRIKELKIK